MKSDRIDRFGDTSLDFVKVTPKVDPKKKPDRPEPKAGDQPKRKA